MSFSWLVFGAALGVLNAWAQRWTVARLRPDAPRRAVSWVVGGAFLRWALVAGLFAAALQWGLLPGLLVFTGLALAKWGSLYRWHRD